MGHMHGLPDRGKQKIGTRKWKAFRRQILERDGWRCTECGKAGRLEVHHVVSRSAGGAVYDPDNCRTLCRRCHIGTHQQPETPAKRRWTELINERLT